ncbi:Zn-ribbon domain-containing OB-fold protein [Halorarius halobius]|uniref:Zn-ribbon domain-containing OB-fold protein n=1 Tax=Halorarius halobius TaxID=2962671 RepID=UPI0020CB83BC|nr:OB-fold domain-containing protein [Halorarius halobius]
MSEPFPAHECDACGARYGHDPAVCRDCGAEAFDTVELSGDGRLYASTVVRVPPTGYEGEAPFVVGLVDVGGPEGVRVTARIEGTERPDPDADVAFVGETDGTLRFEVV